MSKTIPGYKIIKKIKDAKFDIDNLHNYNLLIQIGIQDIQVIITDSLKNQLLFLEDYVLEKPKSYNELQQNLANLFENHHFLMAGFWKLVRISIKNSKFSLVPSALYIQESAIDYLKLNNDVNEETEDILSYEHKNNNIVCVFSINKTISNWIKSLYPNPKVMFIHQSSTIIEGVLQASKYYKNNTLYVYIDRFKLHIVSTKNNSLEYYNQFNVREFKEYTKYVMLVLMGLKKSQNNCELVVWGYIGNKSPHFKEFTKYLKMVSFGKRPKYLRYSFVFDEIQDHHFFDLYNLHICK